MKNFLFSPCLSSQHQIDDVKDESVSLMLHDIIPPDGFDICNTQTLPGVAADKVSANLQVMVNLGREGGGGGRYVSFLLWTF